MAEGKKSTGRSGTTKAAGASAAKRGGKAGGEKAPRQARGGITQAVQPDAQLAPIVGSNPLPRSELTKKVWDYVKKNNLQDAKNRRMINADAKLRPIFGKDQVSMFEMTKLINQHVK
jgi:chromatin remodeling complex protein RSC6